MRCILKLALDKVLVLRLVDDMLNKCMSIADGAAHHAGDRVLILPYYT